MKAWADLPFFNSVEYKNLASFIKQERANGKSVLPSCKLILNAFSLTPFEDVKVVILGQDPYPTKTHAMGLAFSVPKDVKPLPKSLINIYKELKDDLGIIRTAGDLSDWAAQGVLLLNTSLTVVEGQPNSHKDKGWETLTTQAIKTLNNNRTNIVFILWGQNAINKSQFIDEDRHLVIGSPHPSPLSASRGFFGSKPFSKANKYLIDHQITPIWWGEPNTSNRGI